MQSRVYSNGPENTSLTGTHELLAVDPGGIPDRLTRRPQWVVWRLEERKGKLTKVPYDAKNGRPASTTDLMTWSTFAEALAAHKLGGWHGVGFVFCSADPFVGIDFDDVRDPATGRIDEWAVEVIDGFKHKYVEVSPSGRGIHLIVKGSFVRAGINTGSFEMYGYSRFLTITGVTP